MGPVPASVAHTGGSTGYASIAVSRNAVRYSITLSPSAVPGAVAEELSLARSGSAASRDRLLGWMREKLTVTVEDHPCEPAGGFIEAPRANVESVTLVMAFACFAPVRSLVIRDDLFDILGPDHHTLAKIEWPGGVREVAFATEAREVRIALEGEPVASGDIGSFFRLGIEHIMIGYDHLLFLLALLLRGGSLLSLLKIITAFTVAHSMTLSVAALQVIVLPDRLVESVIAASIIWVALENLLPRPPSRRWLVSFLFGLVHGFGFASVLAELELPRANLVSALLGFNLGVEAGQALVVVIALPLLAWVHRRRWEPRFVQVASLALAVAGLAWLLERALLT
jgi:hydrogenase/urease accessory protein HupE